MGVLSPSRSTSLKQEAALDKEIKLTECFHVWTEHAVWNEHMVCTRRWKECGNCYKVENIRTLFKKSNKLH